MKKFRKRLVLSLAVIMILASVLAGCRDKQTSSITDNTTGTKEATTVQKVEEKITMTMFMSNSGAPHPNGVDPSDNSFINIVEKYANVDLQLEIPTWADFQTKLNLLLSSGNLPDIVHSPYTTEMMKRADEGAFIDLKKYYDKSAQVKKYITEEMMEISKSDSGKYYRVPMAFNHAPQGNAVYARWDLVKKYNNNKWPESVPEWIEMMRNMHKAEPNSIVFTNRVIGDYGLSYGGTPIYFWYGAEPFKNRYNYDSGKVVSTFITPEYKAATKVMKQLYDEGILDREFATTDTPKYVEKKVNKNVLWETNNNEQLVPSNLIGYRITKDTPQTNSWEILAAPPLKILPPEVKDRKYTEPFRGTGINDHGIYISSKSKNPDRAWKVIEGFASPELWEAIFWGREGQEYKIENGKRVPIPEKINDSSRAWSLHLALIFGTTDGQDIKKATAELAIGKEYSDMVYKAIEPWDAMAKKNGVSPTSYVMLSEEARKLATGIRPFISQATVEAIMGKITWEQFDGRVKEFEQKFGSYYDEITKKVNDNKAEYIKKGVNFDR